MRRGARLCAPSPQNRRMQGRTAVRPYVFQR